MLVAACIVRVDALRELDALGLPWVPRSPHLGYVEGWPAAVLNHWGREAHFYGWNDVNWPAVRAFLTPERYSLLALGANVADVLKEYHGG